MIKNPITNVEEYILNKIDQEIRQAIYEERNLEQFIQTRYETLLVSINNQIFEFNNSEFFYSPDECSPELLIVKSHNFFMVFDYHAVNYNTVKK